jgi:heme exporter protein A
MSPPESLLSWSNISKSYGRKALFKGLSGQLVSGQSLVVTGINGSGKSTFLKIAAGLLSPDTGDFRRPSLGSMGYCSPSLELYGDLTGGENLLFFAGVLGIEDFNCSDLLASVGLSRSENKPYASYSSGMKQRLKLAFALLRRPKLLILDEPTIALDSDGIKIVEDLIFRQTANGGSALIASNDPLEVVRWSDSRLDIGRKND